MGELSLRDTIRITKAVMSDDDRTAFNSLAPNFVREVAICVLYPQWSFPAKVRATADRLKACN